MSGSIDQIEGGKFRLRMYVDGKQQTIGFYATRAEASVAAEMHAKVLAETAKDYEGLTVDALGHRVLTRREVKKVVRDPASDWSRWRKHVEGDPIAPIAAKRLTSAHVAKWLRRLADKGLTAQTRRNCLNLLRTVLRAALEEGEIKSNPALGLRVEGKSRDAWTYLVPEEQDRLFTAAAVDGPEAYIIGFAMGAGLRAGELVTLRLGDCFVADGEDRPRVVVRYGSAPAEPTKTGAVRTVHLFGVALNCLRAWLRLLPQLRPTNPHRLAFPGERGGFRSENHVLPWGDWKAILARAALGRRFRWHDLRHTCASSLVSGWWGRRWSIEEVKEVLGHTSIGITMRYAHLGESAQERAAVEARQQVRTSQCGAPGPTQTDDLTLRKGLLYSTELRGQEDTSSIDLGKLRFARLRADLPPPDSFLTHDESSPSSEAPQPTGAGPDEVDSSTGEAPVDHSVDRALPLPAPAHWRAEELRSQARGSVLRLGGDLKSPLAGHLVDTLAAHAALYGGRVPPTILGTEVVS